MKKVLIIYNPSSGSKNSEEYASKLKYILKNKKVSTSVYETTGDDNFKSLILNSVNNNYDTIAVLGGDGTVSQIVNVLSTLNVRPTILLLPTGTKNNLAHSLGINLNIDGYLSEIEKRELERKYIDIGKVNDSYFISTVSMGSIPEMAWKTNEEHKEKYGSLGYVFDSFQVLNEEKSFDISLKTDGQEQIIKGVTLLIVGISNSVFGMKTFFEDAQIDDGYLHLYLLKEGSLFSKMSTLVKDVIHKQQDNTEEQSYNLKFKSAVIESKPSLSLAVDGEKGPVMPATIDILPKHLTFYVVV